jgi:predicted KAP-like P-loop ATPase
MFISDQETRIDCLHYKPIARALVRLIKESGETPVTIGVHGDWGAGKSSVLVMAEEILKEEKDVLCIRFNGWRFQGFEDAKASLIESIITEIRDSRPTCKKVKEFATDLLKRVDCLKLSKKALGWGTTLLTGLPTPGIIGDVLGVLSFLKPKKKSGSDEGSTDEGEESTATALLEGLLKPKEEAKIPEQMVEFDKIFIKLLEESKLRKLVVLVDDLDRCLPEIAIETLEAIRLFLFAPKTAFIVAADEGMIQYAVRKHFPDLPQSSGPVSYAQNYLEKLIQVPFRIPALGPVETQIYITLLLAEAELGATDPRFTRLLEKAKEITAKPWLGEILDIQAIQDILGHSARAVSETLRIGPQIYKILADGTSGNPRQIKRFISAMLLRQTVAAERGFGQEIKLPYLAKIMLAERFHPQFFDHLTKIAAQAADGKPTKMADLESEATESPDEDAKSAGDQKMEWSKDPWVKTWAKIEPRLHNQDLRPYLFLTRDKRGVLPGLDGAAHLNGLMEILMGEAMAVRAHEEKIKKLAQNDAQALARAITNKIQEAGELGKQPSGVAGLQSLVKHQNYTRAGVGNFLNSLPPGQLGAWAGTLLEALSEYSEEKTVCDQIRKKWETEGSKDLKAYFTAMKQVSQKAK